MKDQEHMARPVSEGAQEIEQEARYRYALAIALELSEDTDATGAVGQGLLSARRVALMTDALAQGLSGQAVLDWVAAHLDDSGDLVWKRASELGVPVERISPNWLPRDRRLVDPRVIADHMECVLQAEYEAETICWPAGTTGLAEAADAAQAMCENPAQWVRDHYCTDPPILSPADSSGVPSVSQGDRTGTDQVSPEDRTSMPNMSQTGTKHRS